MMPARLWHGLAGGVSSGLLGHNLPSHLLLGESSGSIILLQLPWFSLSNMERGEVLGDCVWFCGLLVFYMAEQHERRENSSRNY